MDCDKMNRLLISICEDGISFKPKNTFLKLDSLRPTIYQINGNFYDDSNGLIRFEILPL